MAVITANEPDGEIALGITLKHNAVRALANAPTSGYAAPTLEWAKEFEHHAKEAAAGELVADWARHAQGDHALRGPGATTFANGLDDVTDDFPSPLLFDDALQVVGRSLHLSRTDQELVREHVRVVRYGVGEIVQERGTVPVRMMFVVSGQVRLEVRSGGAVVGIRTLERGDFLGQTALTREQVKADARALDELTVAWIDRQSMEALVLRRPLLMQEIGRVIEERRASMRRVTAAD